nr:CrcB family protein [Microbacterium lemovicicum]
MTTAPPAPRVDPRILGWVVLGGALGTAVRAALVFPWQTGTDDATLAVPLVTLVVNLVGAFALGLVVGVLGPRHPSARAFLGTGVLGGFTTYSAFAVQTVTVSSWSLGLSVGLALASVAVGFALAGVGVRSGRLLGARRGKADEPEEAE